jgi:hypothetical protein
MTVDLEDLTATAAELTKEFLTIEKMSALCTTTKSLV